MEEDDMVKSRHGNTSYGDEAMRRERAAGPRSLSLGVARIQGLFVYARLISQSRGSIPYRAWC